MIKFVVFISCLGIAGPSLAGSTWFNIMGDPADPNVETIEVNPVPVAINGHLRNLQVRVSRANPRQSWDGVPYRSYLSEVLVDCRRLSARYVLIDFFHQPAWAGNSHNRSVYNENNPRWMAFLDVHPNPTDRIIRAACNSAETSR